MHIDRRLVGFGLFLITVGGVMIAVRQGLLSEPTARQNVRAGLARLREELS